MTWERNVEGMKNHAQRRSHEARHRVDQAITRLLRENKPINFNTVAREAHVTTSYLYTQSDIRTRIESLRLSPVPPKQPRSPFSHERTEASKDLLLAAKDRRMKALEEENSRLKEDLKKALGKLYEKV